MSLYGGIKFTAAELAAAAAKDAQAESANSVAGPSKPTAIPALGGPAKPKPLKKSSAAPSPALAFAPRIKQPRSAAPPSRPIGNYTAAPVIERQPEILGLGSGSNTPDSVGWGRGKGERSEPESVLGHDGRVLARAPAMTLAPEKKGLKRDREEEKKRKKKNKKKKQQQQAFISNFKPEEMYDPNRPNDLGEYQAYRKRLRAEKRAQLVADKLRKEGGGSSGESSYYTDSEEEAPRRDAPRMFAPPKLYSPPPSIAPRFPPRAPEPPSEAAPPPPPPPGGDIDDPYARRLAMTQSLQQPPVMPNFAPPGASAGVHDDPYARRLAMTQSLQQQPPQVMPNFAPSGFRPPVPPPASDIPGFTHYQPPPPPTQPTPAFIDSTFAPPAPAPPFDPAAAAAAKSLEERKAAAAAIAAKFAALAGGGASAPLSAGAPAFTPARQPAVPREEETGTFAEKLMKRWGHVEGSGIGARADGIVHALSAEHTTPSVDPSTLSKRQQAKLKAAAANAKKRKWVQAPNARGKIVNANEDQRAAEERDRLGEASRVVCLTGLVEGEEEVDEELSDEIGEECSKWGIVERVVLHMVEPKPVVEAECLRVFVVFSGLAGAWRATRELDGRFFGGRKIAVKYFDEDRFNAGERDGEIS